MQQGDPIDVCITCFEHSVTISMASQPGWWRGVVNDEARKGLIYKCASGRTFSLRDSHVPELQNHILYTRGDEFTRNNGAWVTSYDSHLKALRAQRDAYAVLLAASRRHGAALRVVCDKAHQIALRQQAIGERSRYYMTAL